MVLRLIASDFLFAAIFLLASCTDFERNNPDDTGSINYVAVQAVVYGEPVTYEGETYKTVAIGEQTWFQRNLNYAVKGSLCYYAGGVEGLSDTIANCATYGRLYDWATAMKLDASCKTSSCASQISTPHQGICPTGWHIPSDDDWSALMTAVGGRLVAGKYLKAVSGWFAGGNGTDNFGFSALPGGSVYAMSGFAYVGKEGCWWTASEYYDHGDDSAILWYMLHDIEYADWDWIDKRDMFSVRCVKDSGGTMPSTSSSSVGGGTSPSSSSANTTNQNGECNAFCKWEESGCVPISTDPKGEYGTIIMTCEAAFSNCLMYSPSRQLHSTDECNGGYINPNITKYEFTDSRDDKSYEFVKIGTQTWMAENLNYNDNANGSKCYDNKEANCAKYGRLYNWKTAKTACPDGWHLPSDAEWGVLVSSAGGSSTAVERLKATSGWSSTEYSGNGSDYYGFAALPGGYGNSSGGFRNVNSGGYWWTATEYVANEQANMRQMGTYYYPESESSYLSVRCVK